MPAPSDSPRRRRLADAGAAAILSACALVVFASAGSGAHVYRYDCGDAVAYPASDALNAYASAVAVLEGDGWANWQTSSRWTLCKIGWKAALVPLAWAFDRDPGRMQLAVTVFLAGIAPGFYLLARATIGGRFAAIGAFAATLLFLATPLERGWWFTRTFLTEGPTLLLVLVVCALAIREARRRTWLASSGLGFGLVAGALALVRSQARFGIAALVVVLALVAARSPAGRRFLAAAALGFCVFVAPVYVKTSVHLGSPYFGTEICSLRAVLHWTESGRTVGGASGLSLAAGGSEAEVIAALSERARGAARLQLDRPAAVVGNAIDRFLFATTGGFTRALGLRWSEITAAAGAALLAIGLAAASRQGIGAILPFAFAAGYFLPNAVYSLFWIRHGVPISWLGVLALTSIGGRLVAPREAAAEPPTGKDRRFPPLAIGAVTLSALATAAMLRSDFAPAPPTAPREIVVPGLDRPFEGHLLLPIRRAPGAPACATGDARLEPARGAETSFLLATSWKRDGAFALRRVRIRGALPTGLRNGDRIVVRPPSGDLAGAEAPAETPRGVAGSSRW